MKKHDQKKGLTEMYRTLSAPVFLQVEITEQCTHSCKHCYNAFRHDNSRPRSLLKSDLSIIADEIGKNKIGRVIMTGGEPLIETENAIFFAGKLQQFPWVVTSLNSNLVLLNEETCRKLKAVGIRGIMTSLMADTPGLCDEIAQCDNAWQRTTNGIKLAKKFGFYISVNMVLTKWNVDRVYQTGELAHKLGADAFGATRASSPTPVTKTFDKNLVSLEELRQSMEALLQLKKNLGIRVDVFEHYPWCAIGDVKKYECFSNRKCNAGVNSMVIGADGQARPCGHSNKQYGSVLEHGLQIPWLKMSDWRKMSYVFHCKDCKHLFKCSGGCAVEAEHSENLRDHHCIGEKGVVSLPQNKTGMEILPIQKFYFSQRVVLRDEKFGGTIISGQNSVLVDKPTSDIIRALIKKGTIFSSEEIAEENGLSLEDTMRTFAVLANKNLIERR